MKENKYLKLLLIQQSFMPLYLLLFIQCWSMHRGQLILDFFSELFHGNFSVIGAALHHAQLFGIIILCLSLLLFIFSLCINLFFNQNQTFGFQEETKEIVKDADVTENSVVFFVTYITPFVLGDIDQCRGFFSFITIIVLLFMLMHKTNMYYQNPFLTLCGYKSFYFHFKGEENSEPMIAITRGDIDPSRIIKRKRIADNVYLVYNKNPKINSDDKASDSAAQQTSETPASEASPTQDNPLSSHPRLASETPASEASPTQDNPLSSLAQQSTDALGSLPSTSKEKQLNLKAD